jgi:L-ascorbate metabolism protein UlaG (beta-lactamase superfamily)
MVAIAAILCNVTVQVSWTQQLKPLPRKAPEEIRLTYLGNAGWEITDGKTVVLADPFLTEFASNRPGQPEPTAPSPQEPCAPDPQEIDARVHSADYIVVTHGHADHALDAPYIARKTGAVIIGNETVANLARAYAVPDKQLIVVRGGEDYDFGTFSLRVIPSIHSALDHKHYFTDGQWAGNAPRGLKAPLKCGDFVEGLSMAYLLRLAGHQVLIMGSMNYIEREMEGLRPDIALVGANAQRKEIYDYEGRLMRALGYPALVMPTHWDQYGWAPAQEKARANAQQFATEVSKASPKTRVLIPRHFEPVAVPSQ